VFLQRDEILEGIHAVQLARVDQLGSADASDQAHEQIPHLGAVLGLVEQTIFAVKDGFL
jgi:hypothetical protein